MVKRVPNIFSFYNADILFLIIVSFLLVAELFFIPAQPQTFDGWSHMLTINGFFQSLSHGSFPVQWVDSVSNYGSPLGQISHQTPAYLGALLVAVTGNTLLSYKLLLLIASIVSTLLYYFFLRLYFSKWASLAAAVLFCLAPYRIMNIYIRGALPEFFATAVIPLLLLGIYYLIQKKSFWGWVMVSMSTFLLTVSHPMMVIIAGVIASTYSMTLLFVNNHHSSNKLKSFLLLLIGGIVGVLLSSYYLFPLLLEIKYFYHSTIGIEKSAYEFLQLSQFLFEKWNYIYSNSPGVREDYKQVGIIETRAVIVGSILIGYKIVKKQSISLIMKWGTITFIICVFLLTAPSDFLYRNLSFLSGLQFPWRFLTSLLFVCPMFLAFSIDQMKYKKLLFCLTIILIAVLRFPQLYGKNYVYFPESRYSFSIVNPHGTDLSTIWSGESWDYPVKSQRIEIIEGNGTISNSVNSPTRHSYHLAAQTPIRMADYTFYFPGWELTVNGQPYPIEFQDPSYRGLITYRLDPGEYDIKLSYTDTKVRLISKSISIATLASLLLASAYYFTRSTGKRNKIAKLLFY